MARRRLDDKFLDILSSPEHWSMISSLAPPDAAPADPGAARTEWSLQNAHSHSHREFLVVLKGAGICGVKGKFYPCRPGTVFYFDPFEEHDNGYPPSASRADHLWITVMSDRISAVVISVTKGTMRTKSGPWVMYQTETGFDAATFLSESVLGGHVPPPWRRARLVSALQTIAIALVELQLRPRREFDRKELQRRVIETVARHILETGGSGASLDNLVRMAGYSRFHFLRLFKRRTGHTVHEYVNIARVKKVKAMQTAGHTHREIGIALGFSCPATFSRWYSSVRRGGRRTRRRVPRHT